MPPVTAASSNTEAVGSAFVRLKLALDEGKVRTLVFAVIDSLLPSQSSSSNLVLGPNFYNFSMASIIMIELSN